ncbi:hypothetical protein THAOC_32681 [Thalassiosira oceanica]|uniref:Uncharacterized protein n=1 Tax=Thalassiosira oceanica TaxID=159749 RepID=K0R8P7_THAOC|nr:hypothetical protein THAOC_32681 [Thalassiosira oceanica]|eukprot:EJK48519.1 hypothetical protein THAOC_32681 [Thalassiosira oceanica]
MSNVDLLSTADQDQSMDGELPSNLNNDINTSQQSAPASTIYYQIEFDVEHIGKNRPQNKRQALWRYCIATSSPGVDDSTTICEHVAQLVWSTHSGKYAIKVDGEEVYSNVAKGSVLEHKWRWDHRNACVVDEGGVQMRILACRKPPTRSSKNFRCYEFLVQGKVYRELPRFGSSASRSDDDAFQNEEREYNQGKLMTILDVIEPGWRAKGYA